MNAPVSRWLLCLLIGGLLAGCGDPQSRALKKLAGKGYSLSAAEFIRAAQAGDAQAVRWFVEAGVEPTLVDGQHRTALGEAVAAGRVQVVGALVALGVKLPLDGEPAAEFLRAAVKSRSLELLRYLLDHQVTGKGLPPGAVSPLALASELGQREAVELLLPFSAGREQEALFAGAQGGDVAVLSLLIRAGASVLERQSESDSTALILAAEAGRMVAVELLFNAGSNRWALDREGRSALDLARAGGHQKVVALLSVEPTAEEREAGALPLKGASLGVNGTWAGALSSLLVLRGCREEALPFMLDQVAEGRATFHRLPAGKGLNLQPKDEIGDTGWYLDRVEPGVAIHGQTGLRLAMLPGVPGRCGRAVAVLEFGPAREVYEALPGDTFTVGGKIEQTYQVDAVTPLAVQLHSLTRAGEKITLSAGALR